MYQVLYHSVQPNTTPTCLLITNPSPLPNPSTSPPVHVSPLPSLEQHVVQQLNQYAQGAAHQEQFAQMLNQKLDAISSLLTVHSPPLPPPHLLPMYLLHLLRASILRSYIVWIRYSNLNRTQQKEEATWIIGVQIWIVTSMP